MQCIYALDCNAIYYVRTYKRYITHNCALYFATHFVRFIYCVFSGLHKPLVFRINRYNSHYLLFDVTTLICTSLALCYAMLSAFCSPFASVAMVLCMFATFALPVYVRGSGRNLGGGAVRVVRSPVAATGRRLGAGDSHGTPPWINGAASRDFSVLSRRIGACQLGSYRLTTWWPSLILG